MGEADAPPLVAAQVDDDAAALLGDPPQGEVELGAAVAAGRAEDVAREALAVHPDQHGLAVGDVAGHEGEVLLAVEEAAEHVAGELSVARSGCARSTPARRASPSGGGTR